MKIIMLKCPNCGATLEYDKKTMYCAYCGEKMLLDDEAKNINFTYSKFDEARIKENETKERVRLKELENQEKEKVRKHITKVGAMIAEAVFTLILVGMFLFDFGIEKPDVDIIKIPSSSKEYKGDNYEQVLRELKDIGFTDIEVIMQEDLVLGLFTKDGSIERISIGGDHDFRAGDIFLKDEHVIITYHTLKKEDENWENIIRV